MDNEEITEEDDFNLDAVLDCDAKEGEQSALELFEQYHKDGKFIIAYDFNTRIFARKSVLQNCLKWAIISVEKIYRQNQENDNAKFEFSLNLILTIHRIESVSLFQCKNNITTKYLLENFDEIIAQQREILSHYGEIWPRDFKLLASSGNLLETIQEKVRLSKSKQQQEAIVKGLEIYRIYLKSIRLIK